MSGGRVCSFSCWPGRAHTRPPNTTEPKEASRSPNRDHRLLTPQSLPDIPAPLPGIDAAEFQIEPQVVDQKQTESEEALAQMDGSHGLPSDPQEVGEPGIDNEQQDAEAANEDVQMEDVQENSGADGLEKDEKVDLMEDDDVGEVSALEKEQELGIVHPQLQTLSEGRLTPMPEETTIVNHLAPASSLSRASSPVQQSPSVNNAEMWETASGPQDSENTTAGFAQTTTTISGGYEEDEVMEEDEEEEEVEEVESPRRLGNSQSAPCKRQRTSSSVPPVKADAPADTPAPDAVALEVSQQPSDSILDPAKPFAGLHFWVDHKRPNRIDLIRRIQKAGGGISVDFPAATHVLVNSYSTEKDQWNPIVDELAKTGVWSVNMQWAIRSLDQGSRLPEQDYLVGNTSSYVLKRPASRDVETDIKPRRGGHAGGGVMRMTAEELADIIAKETALHKGYSIVALSEFLCSEVC